ncbi:Clavaminate synthase-like protein [Lactarius psammicola]|nr:Clavaminate synthase-like protein [Lactarius psammicola]
MIPWSPASHSQEKSSELSKVIFLFSLWFKVATPVQVDPGPYTFVPETKVRKSVAKLVTLDLSKYGTPEGKQELAQSLIKALREKGFSYLKNFNISQEAVNRQFAIGRKFYELPVEEKLKYVPDGLDQGQFNGYVPAGRRILDTNTGIRDRVEIYNIPKFNGDFEHNHPQLVQNNIEEIEQFARLLHSEVLDPLHTLLAIALELPSDYSRGMHKYSVKSEDHLRYMKYTKFTLEENAAIGNNWIPGHTAQIWPASYTLLFRQPVAVLQIRDSIHNEWKSTIRRVVAPPKDRQHSYWHRVGRKQPPQRRGLTVNTAKESSVLPREGFFTQNEFEQSGNPSRQKWQRTKGTHVEDEEYRTARILPGFREQIYT